MSKEYPKKDYPHWVDAYVGGQLRAARKKKGWTQQRFAVAVYTTKQNIWCYESGKNRISASVLWEICYAMDIPYTNLLPRYDKLPDVTGRDLRGINAQV